MGIADTNKMIVLKELLLSVNIGSISSQKKIEHVDLWLAITEYYFKDNNFKVYTEKKSKQRRMYSV